MPITTISAKHSGPITMSRQRNTAISCRTLKGSARVSIPAFRFLRGLPMCNTEYNANVPFASAAFDTCDRESPLHPHSLSAATRLFLPFLLRYRRFFPPTPMHAYLYRPAVHAGSSHGISDSICTFTVFPFTVFSTLLPIYKCTNSVSSFSVNA